jgi:hypothetical protein
MLLQNRFVNKNFYYKVICITSIELSLRLSSEASAQEGRSVHLQQFF